MDRPIRRCHDKSGHVETFRSQQVVQSTRFLQILQFFQTQPAQTGLISHYDQDQGAVDGQVNIAGSQFVETGTVQMQDYPVVEGERPATAYLSSARKKNKTKNSNYSSLFPLFDE